MSQLENIEATEKRLWASADTLRANSNYAGTDKLTAAGRQWRNECAQ